ncbi:PHB depolymerase family esterase [Pseudenhygromyxa sp. WMMC2535]|uniref:extracellular catalytic domain type 1 short-chain-length polyhydroxyalkanoate depolymerase n=1 Tax=Pseudenhygromyxa sp. WMMC2535 TaxID=2712867 RepID=UPI001551DD90|nr:PHB depolymerase family esterase [Pseudenhygromyxa sp. WMMC2535]NVB39105.1 PHB depolymerase family esterase [Pseudenhygromyxa sp. WMMC2535]
MAARSRPSSICLALSLLLAPLACVTAGDDTVEEEWRSWSTTSYGGVSGSVYTPSTEGVIGEGRSLLIVLHGCTQSYSDLRDQGNWVDTAEDYGMVVSIPAVPNGGVYAGCWDYYGSSHSRSSGHAGAIMDHVDALLADSNLDIDPNQVYVAGLSSGAGMSMVMGCLAPDVFAGMGIVAGPTVGTSAFQISSVGTSASAGESTCLSLAGSASGSFATQMTSAVAGTSDYVVAQGYADLNAEIMSSIYADEAGLGSLSSSSFAVSELPGVSPAGTGTEYSDSEGPRVSLISASGMSHAWPAGDGGSGGSFVTGTGIDYARYLAEWFSANNPRVVDGGSTDDGGDTTTDDGGDTTTDDGGDTTTDDGGDTTTDDGGDTTTDDGGDTTTDDGGDTTDDGEELCEPWVSAVTATLSSHFSRFAVYPNGYGVADETYLNLFYAYGTSTAFTLYEGTDGSWYAYPENLPGADCL